MNSLSIVICTRNRCHLLAPLIEHFDGNVILPVSFSLEVILVDNGSIDDTKRAIERLLLIPRRYLLQYAFEEKSGLSNARNRGIALAQFDHISFIDDDALPDSDFLQSIDVAFSRLPDNDCFAHRVVNYSVNKPVWYCLEGKYRMLNRGDYDAGNDSRFLTEVDPVPIGSGMILSKKIFEKFGVFNPLFGYDTSKTMMVPGEESELFFKIKSQKIPVYYVHNAIVRHYPDKEKYEVSVLCRTYRGIGFWYGGVEARGDRGRQRKKWLGYPPSYFRRFFFVGVRYLLSRLAFVKRIRYYHLFQMEKTIGYFMGYKAFDKRC
jgi:glycosyltransferase involved in cell wall biosynthesis